MDCSASLCRFKQSPLGGEEAADGAYRMVRITFLTNPTYGIDTPCTRAPERGEELDAV